MLTGKTGVATNPPPQSNSFSFSTVSETRSVLCSAFFLQLARGTVLSFPEKKGPRIETGISDVGVPYPMKEWVRRQLIERQPPGRPAPVMFQRWLHLLFLHWSLSPEVVQKTLPQGLQVDTFEGKAWIGIVPFFMRGVRPAGLPAFPGISNFLELNLRTYVRDLSGRPGIWFYSLDANQPLAVCFARAAFGLPYEFATMVATISDRGIDYRSQRAGQNRSLRYRYRASRKLGEAGLGTLDFFLVERYRLFAHRRGDLFTGRVHHSPYQLSEASVAEADPALFAMDGFETPAAPSAHALYSERVDVSIYPMDSVKDG
jgi:uncharacterized protein